MPRSRDRHGRGIRGPLALPAPLLARPAPLRRLGRDERFARCVSDAVAQILRRCPDALDGVSVGFERVPTLGSNWWPHGTPLAIAVDSPNPEVVVYQRPIERRAPSRAALAELVHQTIVEQLSALTGRDQAELGGPDFE